MDKQAAFGPNLLVNWIEQYRQYRSFEMTYKRLIKTSDAAVSFGENMYTTAAY